MQHFLLNQTDFVDKKIVVFNRSKQYEKDTPVRKYF